MNILGEVCVGDGVLDVPFVELTEYGKITKKHITALNKHYEHITIQKYVIMPNHIHVLLSVQNSGTSRTPSPTNAVIPSFISTLKRFIQKDSRFS